MEEQKRVFKGIWIPKEIWLDERLTALDKIILTEIDSLDDEITGCTAGNDYFAKFCQCSETKISSAITKLKKLNYIICTNFDGRQRTLKVINESIKKCKADCKKVKAINNNINIISQTNNDLNFSVKKIENNDSLAKNIVKEKKLTKKQLKEKKEQEEQIKINNLIDKFTDDEYIQEMLEQYIDIRKQKGILTAAQVYIILEDLKKECGSNKNYMIGCIRQAIAGGWSQIVFTDKFKGNTKTSYSSVDNTANHEAGNPKISDLDFRFMTFEARKDYISHMDLADMTKDQREFFDKYCLARDENGNLIKF